jgi:hypothetical protein
MDLYWRQLPAAWLAFPLDQAEEVGDPVSRPVGTSVRDLCARLLGLGGQRVAVQFADAGVCWLVLRDGQLASVDGLTERPGDRNRCHTNCSTAWEAEPDRYRIKTGFGLRRGCWRRHTWLLDPAGRVVETTVPQELYFGVILDPEQAWSFTQAGRAEHGIARDPRPKGSAGE